MVPVELKTLPTCVFMQVLSLPPLGPFYFQPSTLYSEIFGLTLLGEGEETGVVFLHLLWHN